MYGLRVSTHRNLAALGTLAAAMAGLAMMRPSEAAGQTVFNFSSGGPNALFEVNNGVVSQIPTGLATNDFPALSLDGRFISISAPDPAQPFQTSTDLFIWDRLIQSRRKLLDFTTQTLQDGSNATTNPSFSAISPSNSLVAVALNLLITTNQGSSVTPRLTMHRFSDGLQTDLVEIGLGNAIDFFRSEFVGISWAPDGSFFATPAYVDVLTATGQLAKAVGIVAYSFNQGQQKWVRSGQLTQPLVFDQVFPAAIQSHVFPVVSPSGQRLAHFLLTWPDALLQNPVTASLVVRNLNGSGAQTLVNFNPGFYPLGLTWSTDGSQLVFSIASQTPGQASGQPSTAVIRAVNASGGSPFPPAGVNGGFFPSQPRFSSPTPDLSMARLRFDPGSGDNFILRGTGLVPGATYFLQDGPDLDSFGSGQPFTGQQIINGLTISRTGSARFFRLSTTP